MKVPLGAAIVAGITCQCATCRGVPLLVPSTEFDDLVVTGLADVPRFDRALEQLNEFARCRSVDEMMKIDDFDQLAKEVHSTYAADQIDPGCKKWAALITHVVREPTPSYWGDLLRHLIAPPAEPQKS